MSNPLTKTTSDPGASSAIARTKSATRLTLRGSLQTMEVPSLIQLIASGRKTGLLRCVLGTNTTKIFFLEGKIVAAESTDPLQTLGQYLIMCNLCSEGDLKRGLEMQKRTGAFLGGALIELGVLERAQLRQALQGKTEEIVCDLFDWGKGSFDFVAQVVDPASHPAALELDLERTLLRGSLRKDKLEQIRQMFPRARTVLRRTNMAFESPDARPFTTKVLALVDGRRSIAEIQLEARGSEYRVGQELLELVDQGYVEIDPSAVAEATEIRSAIDDAESLMSQGRYVEAVAFLRWHLQRNPERQEQRTLLERAQARLVSSIYAHDLAADTVLEVCAEDAGDGPSGLTPEEYFLLSRIDGRWDVRSIVQVSPMEEVEALSGLVRLLRLGIVRDRAAQALVAANR